MISGYNNFDWNTSISNGKTLKTIGQGRMRFMNTGPSLYSVRCSIVIFCRLRPTPRNWGGLQT